MRTDSAERGGSNLEAKRKRLSIVFATLFAVKQGAPEASVSSDTARLCDRCGRHLKNGGRSKPLPYRDRCGRHSKRTVEDACPYKVGGIS